MQINRKLLKQCYDLADKKGLTLRAYGPCSYSVLDFPDPSGMFSKLDFNSIDKVYEFLNSFNN